MRIKKLAILLVAVVTLVAFVSCTTQSIQGTWDIVETINEESDYGQLTVKGSYTFTETEANEGDVVCNADGVLLIDALGKMSFSLAVPGKYSQNNKHISIIYKVQDAGFKSVFRSSGFSKILMEMYKDELKKIIEKNIMSYLCAIDSTEVWNIMTLSDSELIYRVGDAEKKTKLIRKKESQD